MKTPQPNSPITQTQALDITSCLGPDWAVTSAEPNHPQGRADIAYIGADPDLQGATLICLSDCAWTRTAWEWYGYTTDRGLTPHTALSHDDYWMYDLAEIFTPHTHTPEQMASALTHRLLPTFLPAYRKAIQHRRADTRVGKCGRLQRP